MERIKFNAYLEEFPFLREIFRTNAVDGKSALEVDRISIRRADENLLLRVPKEHFHDGSLGKSRDWERVTFVMQNGSILHDYVKRGGCESSNYAHSQTWEWEGERVIDALSRLFNPDDVSYIVWELRDYDNWEGGEITDIYKVSVYKPPKRDSFGAILARAREQALVEVRAEADF